MPASNPPPVDLPWPLAPDPPALPRHPAPAGHTASAHHAQGFLSRTLRLHSHAGTHLDAPAHVIPGAATLDRLPLETFHGPACVLRITSAPTVGLRNLEPLAPLLNGCDFALLSTGAERTWGRAAYFESWPALSPEAAEWLARRGLKGLGVDCPSVDRREDPKLPVHRILLGAGMIAIENLCNLGKLPETGFTLSVLPLPLAEADGCPVRAVGLIPA